VFAGSVLAISMIAMGFYSVRLPALVAAICTIVASVPVVVLGAVSPVAIAVVVLIVIPASCLVLMPQGRVAICALWDRSMLRLPPCERQAWYANLWLWWVATLVVISAIYGVLW